MYDPVTLDQLRAFVAVVEEGSFSAAARKLKRVQSAVSSAMANLETHLGVRLWDRATKIPTLTDQGTSVLGAARRVLAEVDALHRLTGGMAMGIEAHVSLCVDALFPLPLLLDLCKRFTEAFPNVDLRIDTQVMSAVSERVMEGAATLGIASPGGLLPGLERVALLPIRMVAVASPEHPLARIKGRIGKGQLLDTTQIVLSERTFAGVADRGVLAPRTWRVADLHTKHMMLREGLGWGNLPDHLVTADLREGKLVVIRPEAWGKDENTLYLSATYRSDTTFGPAHLWLLAQFPRLSLAPASRVGSKRRTRSVKSSPRAKKALSRRTKRRR